MLIVLQAYKEFTIVSLDMQAFYKSFHENFTLHYSKIEP